MRRIAIASALLIVAAAGSGIPAAESAVLFPAERCDVHHGGAQWRVAVRFAFDRVANARDVSRATLHVTGMSKDAGPLALCPLVTDWGGLSGGFRKRELEGVWRPEDLLREGYEVARDMWLLGEADWTWASFGVTKWRTPGGDLAPAAATVGPGGSADVTDLFKHWLAVPAGNFGVMVKEATEGPDRRRTLADATVWIELEGDGVAVDETPRIDDHPAWLPKTYRADHPRLPYPTAAWLAALKADEERLAALCKSADSFDPAKGRAALLGNLALAQRLAPAPQRAELIRRAIDAPYPNHGGFAICYGLATLYDWGYDLLAPADRRRLAWRLERLCWNEEQGSSDTLISPYNDVGTSRFGCGLLWAALAVYPDIPGARKHLWRAKAYYIDTSVPVWHQILGDHGGYWHEMHGYYLEACIGNALARCLSAWSSATGDDLYAKNPWLENAIYFAIYSTRPDLYRLRSGDIKCGDYYYGEDPVNLYSLPALAQRYDNPYGRWWLERTGSARFDGVTPTEDPWGEPFATDASRKSWDALPLARHSDGLGMVNLRSDWSEDASAVWFRCGPSYWSHMHGDSGAFAIYKRGALAVDCGNYNAGFNSEHCLLYAKTSLAHNVVTVTDPDEPPVRRGEWAFPNDGGQRFTWAGSPTAAPYSVSEFTKRREEFDTGSIVAFQTTAAFTYVVGDVTKAYTNAASGTGDAAARSRRVRRLLRSLVYLPPDHVVVFDQVDSFDKAFRKRWLLHTINEPTVEGNLTTVQRADLCFRFTSWDHRLKHAVRAGKDHPFFKEHPDCTWYGGYQPQLYQYDGVMFVRTLLPRDPQIEVIGGPGKECWFAGKNHDGALGGKTVAFRPYTGEGEAGRYRIEISPRAQAENDRFLNVIQVGLKSGGATPTAARLLDRGEGTGVDVELGDARSARITFKPGVGGHLTITRAGRALVDTDFAETVQPNPQIVK